MLTRRLLSLDSGDRSATVFVSVLLAVAVAVPVLNLAVPESSALHLSPYAMTLIGKYLCFAMLALAVDLVWASAESSVSVTRRSLRSAVMRWACI